MTGTSEPIVINFEVLDALERKNRVDAIDDAIHRLNFERRLTLLSERQHRHMADESLTHIEKEKLGRLKTEDERETYINDIARTRYFRRMAWVAYLNGETKEPPIPDDSQEGA